MFFLQTITCYGSNKSELCTEMNTGVGRLVINALVSFMIQVLCPWPSSQGGGGGAGEAGGGAL